MTILLLMLGLVCQTGSVVACDVCTVLCSAVGIQFCRPVIDAFVIKNYSPHRFYDLCLWSNTARSLANHLHISSKHPKAQLTR